jgi:hypothetical protein
MNLRALPVELDADVEALRLIRNACKDGFSHDNAEISPAAQLAWWVLMRGRVKAWLYSADGHLVGYGLVRQTDDGRWWASVAVLPEEAGQGYGGTITADLVRRVDVPVWGQARLDQPAAMRLHRAADWEEIERDDRLVTYRTLPHVYDVVLGNWAEHGLVVT